MKIIKIEGLVVGEQNYSESSKILKIFTKEKGLISVLSKGCKKPKSPLREGSNKLIYGNFDISFRDNGISTLIGIDIKDIFKNIVMDYHDLEKKMYTFVMIDVTLQVISDKEVDEEESKEIYDILISSIKKINEGINPKVLLDVVMLKYLKFLGVLPSLDSCAICGSTTNIITLDSSAFGFVCSECYSNQVIVNKNALKLIRMLYYVDIDKIKNLDVGEEIQDIEKFIDDYYESHTGIYFNIKKKLVTLRKMQAVL
jgi:DNA repair protein RecO (recombination protein O)